MTVPTEHFTTSEPRNLCSPETSIDAYRSSEIVKCPVSFPVVIMAAQEEGYLHC